MRKDNSTLARKVALRREVLKYIPRPVVVETHGGMGAVGRACYSGIAGGVVFEKDPARAELLAHDRPTWAVYEADVERSLATGAGAHVEATLLDVDPWGSSLPTIAAFFASERERAKELWLVVNDGARMKCRIGAAWTFAAMRPAVEKFGNDLFDRYLEAMRFLVGGEARREGYELRRWHGYYCGGFSNMTHFAACFVRD